MKVYILNSGFDYEGESFVAVFASQGVACRYANARAAQRGWLDGEWVRNVEDDGIEMRFGSSTYVIREAEVLAE